MIFVTPQCSSGTTQSRPFPARAVKRLVSAGHYYAAPRGTAIQSAAAHPSIFFWARPGFELASRPEDARRGCLVGHVKSSEAKAETITSSLWSSARTALSSLLRPKNRSPFVARCSLLPDERRSERRNAVSDQLRHCLNPQNDSVVESVGNHASPEACNPAAGIVVSDAGSIPAASIPLLNLQSQICNLQFSTP